MNLQAEWEEWKAIADETPDEADPRDLVDRMEKDESFAPKLRAHLTWDDREAAHEHRVQQMRHLLGRIKLVVNDGGARNETVRGLVAVRLAPAERDPGRPHRTHRWRDVESVLADPEARARAEQDMERAIRALIVRYDQFRGLASEVLRRVADDLDRGHDEQAV